MPVTQIIHTIKNLKPYQSTDSVLMNNVVLLFDSEVNFFFLTEEHIRSNYITKSISPACRESCWNNAVDI